jgi:hypothetical protein
VTFLSHTFGVQRRVSLAHEHAPAFLPVAEEGRHAA